MTIVIYNHHIFIVKATDAPNLCSYFSPPTQNFNFYTAFLHISLHLKTNLLVLMPQSWTVFLDRQAVQALRN